VLDYPRRARDPARLSSPPLGSNYGKRSDDHVCAAPLPGPVLASPKSSPSQSASVNDPSGFIALGAYRWSGSPLAEKTHLGALRHEFSAPVLDLDVVADDHIEIHVCTFTEDTIPIAPSHLGLMPDAGALADNYFADTSAVGSINSWGSERIPPEF